MPEISDLDHLVLTARDLDATIAFYREGLGMRLERFTTPTGDTRMALIFGTKKDQPARRPHTFRTARRHTDPRGA